MAVSIVPGYTFQNGETVTPSKLHQLIDGTVVSNLPLSALDLSSAFPLGYGSTRPNLVRGRIHYDTTPGLEGLYYAFLSASSGSVSGWLCAMPRREGYCWASSAISAFTPVFMQRPSNLTAAVELTVYDGSVFPNVWEHSGTSGCMEGMYLTLESASAGSPVKCMWAGLVPQTAALRGLTSDSGASVGSPLFVVRDSSAVFRAGNPVNRGYVFGVNTLNSPSGHGALIWSGVPVIADN